MIRIALFLCIIGSCWASTVEVGYDRIGLNEALRLYDRVVNSEEFELISRQLIAFESDNKVYERFQRGWEVGYGLPDGRHNFNLETANPKDKLTIAYVYFGYPTIFYNPRYLNTSSIFEIVGTICHEYAHLLGYRHTLELYEYRVLTVPYQIGYACETIARNIYSSELKE